MDFSFLFSLISTLWDFITGITRIIGWLGLDGIASLAGLLGGAQ
jgi:hypothetical protein